MPTGYTAGILDGTITTFPQFAKLCMRAFGAAMHLRDESLEDEYTPRVPSDYHPKEIAKANKLLTDSRTLSDEVIIANKKAELESSKEYHLGAIEKAEKNTEILNKILAEVNNWNPPTEEHTGIKDFMIDQIKKTIDFDCNSSYHNKALVEIEFDLRNLNSLNIRSSMVEKAKKDLKYHTAENLKELKRCEDSNKWVTDFINSFNQTLIN
jgi:hypothetical protein